MLVRGHDVHADACGFKRSAGSRADSSHLGFRRNPGMQGRPAGGRLLLQSQDRGDTADHEPFKPPCAEGIEGTAKGCLVPGPFEVLKREQERPQATSEDIEEAKEKIEVPIKKESADEGTEIAREGGS